MLIAQTAPESTREPFTDDEISLLWKHKNDPIIDIVLIFIYSGWRITEFTNLEIANIDLEQGTMKGGIKTQNGKNRIVPIHSKIRPFIEKYYSKDKIYLCSEKSTPLNVTILRRQWIASLEKLNITGKTPHCARHTFETLLDRYGANKRCRDLMTGHNKRYWRQSLQPQNDRRTKTEYRTNNNLTTNFRIILIFRGFSKIPFKIY